MRNKEEQLSKAYEVIEKQAKELIENYGWNKEHVRDLAWSLKMHAGEEIANFGDVEDISDCLELVSWKLNFKTKLIHNFKELKDTGDTNKLDELRSLVYKLSDEFKYIENIELDRMDFIAEYKDNKGQFAVKLANEKYLVWDLSEIQEGVKKLGMFEVAKRIYNKVLETNKEI